MIPYFRPKLSDFYALFESKLAENHTLHSGTYLYSSYMGVPPPPPPGKRPRISPVAASSFAQSSRATELLGKEKDCSQPNIHKALLLKYIPSIVSKLSSMSIVMPAKSYFKQYYGDISPLTLEGFLNPAPPNPKPSRLCADIVPFPRVWISPG